LSSTANYWEEREQGASGTNVGLRVPGRAHHQPPPPMVARPTEPCVGPHPFPFPYGSAFVVPVSLLTPCGTWRARLRRSLCTHGVSWYGVASNVAIDVPASLGIHTCCVRWWTVDDVLLNCSSLSAPCNGGLDVLVCTKRQPQVKPAKHACPTHPTIPPLGKGAPTCPPLSTCVPATASVGRTGAPEDHIFILTLSYVPRMFRDA
jgi:hypothetical protein